MKKIQLNDTHESLGAKMVEFAGYYMPVQYAGVREEHMCVREAVGIFDVSHMGEFVLKGENALALIQKVTSNDASTLEIGKVQYTCMPNGKGGIVDDLLVYHIDENEYVLVVNASNIEKDWNWITSHNDLGVEMKDISDNMSLFAVQGPKATDLVKKITEIPVQEMKYYSCRFGELGGSKTVLISTTGYTGAGGFEIYVPNGDAELVWESIMGAGEEFGLQPIGLAARDTLRLEMGFCLYGNDITDNTSPIEAGLGWITKFTKDFIDKDTLLEQKRAGTSRRLVGFLMQERGIPRQGYEIQDEMGNVIGEVTSGTMSPVLNQGIGMGYVQSKYKNEGTEIFIAIRNKRVKATVNRPPFIGK
ncbi:MAG: glycine cleavage system aminomethyltransferase GcvT [Flavobacteriales bacterium]|nr:glycine cleavage system aminomethyltransferase GcvT [Flavobacteriales bacterium]